MKRWYDYLLITVTVEAYHQKDEGANDHINHSCDPGVHNGDGHCRKDGDSGDHADGSHKDKSGDGDIILVRIVETEDEDKGGSDRDGGLY